MTRSALTGRGLLPRLADGQQLASGPLRSLVTFQWTAGDGGSHYPDGMIRHHRVRVTAMTTGQAGRRGHHAEPDIAILMAGRGAGSLVIVAAMRRHRSRGPALPVS